MQHAATREEDGEIILETSESKNKNKFKTDIELGTISKAKRRHNKKKVDKFDALKSYVYYLFRMIANILQGRRSLIATNFPPQGRIRGGQSPQYQERGVGYDQRHLWTFCCLEHAVYPLHALKLHISDYIFSPMVKRMTKFELMRYRRYRSQAESSR